MHHKLTEEIKLVDTETVTESNVALGGKLDDITPDK